MSVDNKEQISGWWILFWVLLSFVDYGGYGYVFGVLAAIFAFFQIERKNFFYSADMTLILLFSILYVSFLYLNEYEYGIGFYISFLIMPFAFYAIGQYLCAINTSKNVYRILFLVFVAIASLSIASIIFEIYNVGFFGEGRNIHLIGLSSVDKIAATILNARLLGIYALFGLVAYDLNVRVKRPYLLFSYLLMILVLVLALRLGSRTGLVIALCAIVASVFYYWKTNTWRSRSNMILFLITLSVCVAVFMSNDNVYLSFFMDRLDDEDSSFLNMGGRKFGFEDNLSLLLDNPWGTPEAMHLRYAHNLWIDVARVSGFFPLIVLVIITFRYLAYVKFIFKIRTKGNHVLLILFVLSMCLMIQFFLEPILEGLMALYYLFCFVFGIMSRIIIDNSCANEDAN